MEKLIQFQGHAVTKKDGELTAHKLLDREHRKSVRIKKLAANHLLYNVSKALQ